MCCCQLKKYFHISMSLIWGVTFWPLFGKYARYVSVIWSILPNNCFHTILAQPLNLFKMLNVYRNKCKKKSFVLTNEVFTVRYCPHMNNNSIIVDWELKPTLKQTVIDWFSFSSCYRWFVDWCNCSITEHATLWLFQ